VTGAALWLEGFGVTLALEEAVALPLLRDAEPSVARRAMAILVANLATHPLVWFFFTQLGWSRPWGEVAAEVWAVGFEAVVYRLVLPAASWKVCATTSLAANTTSLVAGLVLMQLGMFR
jgi:hypothetical protein